MLPEQFSQDEAYEDKPKRQEVEFVGAPTEYADEAEVSDAVGLIAKVLAGGAISSAYIAGIVALVGVGCAVCTLFYVIANVLLQ